MELEPRVDRGDQPGQPRLLMPARQIPSIGPRLTLNRGQRALAFILLLLLITLLIVSFRASAAQREHNAMRARTEIASHNAFYTVRDTLSTPNEAERYLLGGTTRRAVQVTRALLGQRLQVLGTDGVTAGDAATPAYRSALSAMDDAIRQVPAGVLPPMSVRAGPMLSCRGPMLSPRPPAG